MYDEVVNPKPIELEENKAYGPLLQTTDTVTVEYEVPDQVMRRERDEIETSRNEAYGRIRN